MCYSHPDYGSHHKGVTWVRPNSNLGKATWTLGLVGLGLVKLGPGLGLKFLYLTSSQMCFKSDTGRQKLNPINDLLAQPSLGLQNSTWGWTARVSSVLIGPTIVFWCGWVGPRMIQPEPLWMNSSLTNLFSHGLIKLRPGPCLTLVWLDLGVFFSTMDRVEVSFVAQ